MALERMTIIYHVHVCMALERMTIIYCDDLTLIEYYLLYLSNLGVEV